jgi:dihydroorotate dehydrogenase
LDVYQELFRPVLFRLSAERAHSLGRAALRVSSAFRLFDATQPADDPRLATDLAGIRLSNPVGLAPGFEKDGRFLPSLERLGFGYVVAGTITEHRQPGNPRPRLVRYPERRSLVNAMGLPNPGAHAAAAGLASHPVRRTTLLAAVGGASPEAIVAAARVIAPHVSALEVGLVCPNASATERMRERAMVDQLLADLMPWVGRPVFVKLPPHRTPDEQRQIFHIIDACTGAGVAGVSVSGGRRVEEPGIAVGRGNLSGRDTTADALRIVADVAQHARGRLLVRAAGGVFTGDDALEMFRAGATTVEIYTAFVYRGWRAARAITTRLVELMDEAGAGSIAELARVRPPIGGVSP